MNEPDSESTPTVPVAKPPTFVRHVRRYMTVGAFSTITDYTVYLSLIHLAGWPAVGAAAVSRPCGGVVSFSFNKVWTFERRAVRGTGTQLFRYACVWLSAYAASTLLVWLFRDHLNWTELPSKIVADSIVNSIAFLIVRHWAFQASAAARGKL